MEIGNRIKKYRENIKLSQEELADKVYVSRQTISNWENNKSYPDITSLKILTNIFNVSLDQFIEGDIEEMKKIISAKEMSDYNRLSMLFTIEMVIVLLSTYPLLKFLQIKGFIIWFIMLIITFITSIKIEKIYKKYDVRTYKEIVAFTEGKSLSKNEEIEEKAKRPYQKFLLTVLSGIIAITVFALLEFIFG